MSEPTHPSPGKIAAAWWCGLQPRPDGSGGDRAALARLRRAATTNEAAAEPATLELCRALRFCRERLGRAAITAAVLAHVREDAPGPPAARQLGTGNNGAAAMSWLRFQRLIQADTEDSQLTAFRRAVALADRRLNVVDLACSLLDWDDRQRRRWLYAYHDAAVPDRAGDAPTGADLGPATGPSGKDDAA